MCLQGGRAHLLTAWWGGHTKKLSSKVRVGVGVRGRVRAQGDWDTSRTTPSHLEGRAHGALRSHPQGPQAATL
jgi:hypothetical protein